ncbi:MAG: MFS transporter [Pseudomonadota bacterium]
MKQTADAGYPARGYAWYVVSLLIVAYIVAFIDRGILALLVNPIKAQLGLTDVQMSWLMGPAFGIFYATLGIPIAIIADRRSRRNIIVIGVALWSLATAACGLAWSYASLFVARMMVGVGEATLTPCAYSIIPDYFPRKAALRAVGLYTIGQSIGAGLAFLAGGQVIILVSRSASVAWPIVGPLQPWQMVFVILGVLGLALAAVMLTIREPTRRGFATEAAGSGRKTVPLAATVAFLTSRWRAFAGIFIGNSVVTTIGYSYFWLPTVFERTWQLDAAQTGVYYGLVLAIGGPLGVITGSRLAETLYARGRSEAPYLVFAASILGTLPFAVWLPLASSAAVAIIALIPVIFGLAVASATSSAALVHIAPAEFRAQISALYLLVISLAGLFLGPPSVAALTDYVFQDESMIRYSLLIVTCGIGPIGLAALWLGRGPYRQLAMEADNWHEA